MTLQRLDRGGFSLAWDDAGPRDAPATLLLAHSMTSSLRIWDPHVAALADRYRILRWDNRGHGASDAPPGPYTLDDFADDACAILDAAGVRTVHAVGLSVGGMIMQHLAIRHPARVASLVLVDTTGRYPPETIGKWAERAALVRREGMEPVARNVSTNVFPPEFLARSPEVVAGLANEMRRADPTGYAHVCEAIPALDTLAALAHLRVPSLVVVGELDRQLPVALSRELHAALPGSRLEIVPGAGHFVPIEAPATFTGLLERFLDEIGARGPRTTERTPS